ncbi:hypothetical protein NWUPM366V_23 [Escherichia phage vB_EcoM_366V_SA_NWU]|uniref:Uncharacterized protein n=10 Tax=root TaxID=1 RepID=A0A6B9WT73_9CAUD|nr:hypothetical protein [Escherichia coli]EKM3217807.1 hypothetical protein [Escherichia coli O157]QHR66556.1 hypothetical protein ime_197 [Escherichia phage ime]QHR66895.1 hypothetical protein nomo_198 [Escherichia phage nomo]QHR73199.1 hypothetical protein nimi_173 [Escherichia phage nimi]QLF82511.1 hypothetical protein F10B_0064 [Escherichia phage vB_EcoM_Gotham]QOC67648.1 hypothetical protein JEP1_022 [Escherichia phage JEP1]QXN68824.1 hypothetical protein SOPHIAROSE_43 [Escherichia phag
MATLYSDILMDPQTGDLAIDKGLELIDSNQVSLRQRLWMRFNTWKGSWYFDELFGFPYMDFLSKKVMKTVLDNKIMEVARQEPDVLNIVNFQSTMDRRSRTYQAFFEVVTKENEIVRLAFVGLDQFTYPQPDSGTTSLCDDEGWIKWANKLYYLINFRLPRTGDATWWNQYAGPEMENPIPVGSLLTQDKDLLMTEAEQTINRNTWTLAPDEREYSGVIATSNDEAIANQSGRAIDVN